jgi:hypothetical protein
MPYDGANDDIETDFDVLEVIGRHVDDLVTGVVRAGGPQRTVRRWLVGHCEPPEDTDEQITLFAAASDLELFTPSMSGRTPVDRYLNRQQPQSDLERAAFDALGAAQFRLVRIVGRDGPDLVRLRDLTTGDDLVLLNSRISPLAAGAPSAMRLCPLASGRHMLISPLFLMDEAMLAAATRLVRPGRPLGHGHRCAANVYRDMARGGFIPMPTLVAPFEPAMLLDAVEFLEDATEVQRLAVRWLACGGEGDQAELVAEIRRAASLDNLVDACGWCAKAAAAGTERVERAFRQVADILMETLCERARAGVGGYGDILDRAAAEIDRHIASGAMHAEARTLFERSRTRWSSRGRAQDDKTGSTVRAELDAVIQRILALRAKTVDRGCTEEEAMSAAAKVAELLARHDLSLDEVGVRNANCAGAAVETNHRRRGPIDACVQPVAMFCDCRAWSEDNADGALRYVFFGLRADVEAARFLHDLIETTFETESAAFRKGGIYNGHQGAHRRASLKSFQIGLANGIADKLDRLKTARTANAAATTGFDLVAVKHSVVDDEMERLGLRFTTKTSSSRRLVHGDAYEAGKTVGAQFEPHPSLCR